LKSRTEILVPLAAIQAVPIAVIAWYRLHRYAWYRYSAIVICFDETCSAPLDMLFVHLLPKGEHSYLMLGYDKRHVSRRLMMLLKKWKKVLVHDTDFRTLYDILCHCSNNWCISPDCDERLLSALISRYSEDRMTVVFNEK